MNLFQLRADRICQTLIPALKSGARVLDVGAGTCLISQKLRDVAMVDMTCSDIKDYNETDLPLVVSEPDHLPFDDDSFDVVLLIFVLHHSINPQKLIKEAKRVCRGKIIIMEDVYVNTWDRWLISVVDILLNLWYKVKAPLNFLTNEGWLRLFTSLRLKLDSQKFFTILSLDPVKHVLYVLSKNVGD